MTRPNETPTAPRDDAALVPEATARERERRAVLHAVAAVFDHFQLGPESRRCGEWEGSAALAERLYPAPQLPRVVPDPHGARLGLTSLTALWRVEYDATHRRTLIAVGNEKVGFGFYPNVQSHLVATPERVALWADLLANPTEPSDAPAADAAGRA